MDMIEVMKRRRSIRKFTQAPIAEDVLHTLVDVARLAPYPMNLQPLKFAIVTDTGMRARLFACTKWAGYLKDGAPTEGQRPTAYIVMLGDTSIKANADFQCEYGIAGSHIVLAAAAHGIASCWLGALNRDGIAEILSLPEHLTVGDVIALGYPAEESRIVPYTGDIKYFMGEDGVLGVPKRSMDEILYDTKEKHI